MKALKYVGISVLSAVVIAATGCSSKDGKNISNNLGGAMEGYGYGDGYVNNWLDDDNYGYGYGTNDYTDGYGTDGNTSGMYQNNGYGYGYGASGIYPEGYGNNYAANGYTSGYENNYNLGYGNDYATGDTTGTSGVTGTISAQ